MTKDLSRRIFLSGVIDSNTVCSVIEKIFDLNQYDLERDKIEKSYKAKPIQIIINSPGGSVYDGFGLIDVMRQSKTPIHTYCFGMAASMALGIFLMGDVRHIGKNSSVMYHDNSTFFGGTSEQFSRKTAEMERLLDMYDEIVLERTSILSDKLKDVRIKVDNWYIDSREAVKLKIAQHII